MNKLLCKFSHIRWQNVLLLAGMFLAVLCMNTIKANEMNNMEQQLDNRQQKIALIAGLTAKGDLPLLKEELKQGLDAGLAINEIKEVLVQMYAYAGFPRSLQGINTFMAVLEERKANGISDQQGRDASPIPDRGNKYERGKKVLEELTGRPETGPKTGLAAFSPEIDVFLKEHLFADIFERDILSYQDREIATISALVSMGGVEPMLQSHMNMGMNAGITEQQLRELLSVLESRVGKQQAETGRAILDKLLQGRK